MKKVLFLIVLAQISFNAQARIYKCVNEQGQVSYGTQPCTMPRVGGDTDASPAPRSDPKPETSTRTSSGSTSGSTSESSADSGDYDDNSVTTDQDAKPRPARYEDVRPDGFSGSISSSFGQFEVKDVYAVYKKKLNQLRVYIASVELGEKLRKSIKNGGYLWGLGYTRNEYGERVAKPFMVVTVYFRKNMKPVPDNITMYTMQITNMHDVNSSKATPNTTWNSRHPDNDYSEGSLLASHFAKIEMITDAIDGRIQFTFTGDKTAPDKNKFSWNVTVQSNLYVVE